MKSVKILDCTLRDGGRIIDCDFGDKSIARICTDLTEAKIDIVEIGFLRKDITYKEGSTFFTDVNQIKPFIRLNTNTMYVAFTDVGMFDYETLPFCDGTSITGIRVGFTKDYLSEAMDAMKIVKDKGYTLFVQAVNTLGYTDDELVGVIEKTNEMEPYSFGIVDTYGAMYVDDAQRLFAVVDGVLASGVKIDFHSHNNYQMSFALAQEMIKLCNNRRGLVIDATVYGMGKGAGNLNTELIVDYLVRKNQSDYELDILLDLIDEVLLSHYQKQYWGYSVPALMSGVYKAHPNNVIYLTKKFKLDAKDIKNILGMLDEDKRKSYDYDTIDRVYTEYSSNQVNDKDAMTQLKTAVEGHDILILAPGSSILDYKNKVATFIDEVRPVVISINFESEYSGNEIYAFFNNKKKYEASLPLPAGRRVILPSNVESISGQELVVNYASLVERGCKHFDNAAIMAMRLLKKFNISSLTIAGLDGFSLSGENYTDQVANKNNRYLSESEEVNSDIRMMLSNYVQSVDERFPIRFLTPSLFEDIVGMHPTTNDDIRCLVMDVDGTLTDGAINISDTGECYKRFNVKDGYGIVKLKQAGMVPVIITGRASGIVEVRARELDIEHVYQDVRDKKAELQRFLQNMQWGWHNVAYIGDDVNDIDCMKKVALAACPGDALESVKEVAHYVCNHVGGDGAVRELCDYLLAKRNNRLMGS